MKSTKCSVVPMTGMPHKRFFFLSHYLSVQNSAASSKTQQTCDSTYTQMAKEYGKYCMTRLLFEDTGELDEVA